jgi:hypothetical protein
MVFHDREAPLSGARRRADGVTLRRRVRTIAVLLLLVTPAALVQRRDFNGRFVQMRVTAGSRSSA